jgi:hypothetical protein
VAVTELTVCRLSRSVRATLVKDTLGSDWSSLALSGLGKRSRRRGWVSVPVGLPGGCINQGEAAGQPTDPALTSATLGTGGAVLTELGLAELRLTAAQLYLPGVPWLVDQPR